jgi:chaperonin GroES
MRVAADSVQEKPKSGEVIAIGPGKTNDQGRIIPMHVKLGDKVLFSTYAGSSVDLGQDSTDELLVMSEDDVLAIIG